MMKTPNRSFLLAAFAVLTTAPYLAAQGNVVIDINGPGGKGSMAVPDFRGSGDAQKFMGTFNQTLWNELDQSGAFRMVPKTSYPLQVPQMPRLRRHRHGGERLLPQQRPDHGWPIGPAPR